MIPAVWKKRQEDQESLDPTPLWDPSLCDAGVAPKQTEMFRIFLEYYRWSVGLGPPGFPGLGERKCHRLATIAVGQSL